MKWVVIISAILLALVGYLASATSPNPSDHLAGNILIAIAVGFVLLALFAPPRVTAWVYFGAIALVVVANVLSKSYWKTRSAKEQTTKQQGSEPPADDR
jgi:Ca2+/Na+ antiporter